MSDNIKYTGDDAESIKNRFIRLDKNLIDRLCQYLKDNNKVIVATPCYDSRSGWHGIDFFIDKANLSLNGYCLGDGEIEMFLNGDKNPMWYHFWEPEYEEAKKWVNENKK